MQVPTTFAALAFAAALLAPLRSAGPAAAPAIAWAASLAAAKERAEAEQKPLFIAINMDGERANDTLADEVYRDKAIVALAATTVNVVASTGQHGKAECPRFGAVTCAQHQDVEVKVRHGVLNVTSGPVVAPQHVFLHPDGKVLLSVPYEVRAGELEWCFHEAWRRVDPAYSGKPSARAQKPGRLVIEGVAASSEAAPVTRARALELIKELRKGTGQHHELLYELARADEPEARDELRQFLRQGPQMGADGTIGRDWRPPLLRWLGDVGPASSAELIVDFVGSGEVQLRHEAIVALEQLAAPEALGELMQQLRKEKEPRVRAALLRAIGACGAKDSKARGALVKAAKDKDAGLRRAALLALGWLEPHEQSDGALAAGFAAADPSERAAAALGMALSRAPRWIAVLEPVAGAPATPAELQATAALCLEVLRGAPYARLAAELTRVADDGVARGRHFGK